MRRRLKNCLDKKGVDVNATGKKHRSTALMWAAHNGQRGGGKSVDLDSGAAIDARRKRVKRHCGLPPKKGQLETLKILKYKTASKTGIVGRDGDTAIAIDREKRPFRRCRVSDLLRRFRIVT